MPDIFNLEDNEILISRLQKLNPDKVPQWGKMNVSQMVLHCQKPLEVAEGKILLKRNLFGYLFGKMAKKSFLKEEDLKKSLPTAPEFKITENPDFENEWELLIALVKKFGAKGPKIITNKTHPFFGEMTEKEWGTLQYKHLDHHLKQFDV